MMERFYTHLRSSESIIHSLTKTKQEMINSEALSHPYYWAGFVVSGKTEQKIFTPHYRYYIVMGILFLMIFAVLFLIVDKMRKPH
jgi:5-methylthioribose kinase